MPPPEIRIIFNARPAVGVYQMPIPSSLSQDQRPGSALARVHLLLRNLMLETGMSHGDRIPSERELAERFGISRMTVRKALTQLVDAGHLERRGTAGTFLPEPAVVRPLSKRVSTAISEVVGQAGHKPGARLLFFRCGDLVVEIVVETPTKLTARQKELLEEFRETETGEECPQSSGFFSKIKDMWDDLTD